jgi:hypothetical protein
VMAGLLFDPEAARPPEIQKLLSACPLAPA